MIHRRTDRPALAARGVPGRAWRASTRCRHGTWSSCGAITRTWPATRPRALDGRPAG
jgi:hypothetical protein